MRMVLPDFWSEFWNPTDAYTSALTNLVVSFWIGLSPFCLEGPKGERRIVKKLFGYINSVLHIGFFIVCSVIAMIKNESILQYFFRTDVSIISDTFLRIVWFLGIPVLYYSALSRCSELALLLKTFYIIDSKLKVRGITFDYRMAMRMSTFMSAIVTICNLAFVGYTLMILIKNGIYPSFPACVAFFQPNAYISCTIILYGGMCTRILKRFDSHNKVGRYIYNFLRKFASIRGSWNYCIHSGVQAHSVFSLKHLPENCIIIKLLH